MYYISNLLLSIDQVLALLYLSFINTATIVIIQPIIINVFAVVVNFNKNAHVNDIQAVNKLSVNLLNAVILGLIVLFVKLFKYRVINALYGPLNAY